MITLTASSLCTVLILEHELACRTTEARCSHYRGLTVQGYTTVKKASHSVHQHRACLSKL